MKKVQLKTALLLYLIPLLLLILCDTNWALYRDTVNYSTTPPLLSLTPSDWQLSNFSVSSSVSLQGLNFGSVGTPPTTTPPLNKGASFKGFPFAFYLSSGGSTHNANVNSTASISAWSWLWATADGLLILIALIAAFFVNRHLQHSYQSVLNPAMPAGFGQQPLPATPSSLPTNPAQFIFVPHNEATPAPTQPNLPNTSSSLDQTNQPAAVPTSWSQMPTINQVPLETRPPQDYSPAGPQPQTPPQLQQPSVPDQNSYWPNQLQ
jgi:hypothetical protein